MYGSSNSYRDGNEGGGLSPIVYDDVNQWIIFGVLVHEDSFMEFVVAVREFDELDYVWEGGCHRCLCLVLGSNYA